MAADLLEAAATGSGEAQSALVDQALACRSDPQYRPCEALAVAEVFARMAASSASTFGNIRRLASVLMMRAAYERAYGEPSRAANCDAEALTLLDGAADLGDELAGRVLAEAASVMPSAGFVRAREFRAP